MTTLVIPGDAIPTSSSSLTVGPGITSSLSRSSQTPNLIAIKAGHLISEKGKGKADNAPVDSVIVESSSKRYIPAPKDLVLGTIIHRHSEGYRVDLGSAQMASLDALAFEGATKRSKPNLKVGTLVYARVTIASRDMEPELECFDAATGKSDGFGELKGGCVVTVSLQLARQLLNPKFTLLQTLASSIPFEIAIGINGKVWIKSPSISETIALKRVLEGVDEGQFGITKGELDRAVKEFAA
ncbi:hypothetical protein DB88DRAFT_483740 [Papiliotrema laurentii]|uniref:Ribosomal RNA-processing protein 40 n=1 Tax=Papiliotrema laurentii TaxID=5418 RepID=A0AAD9FSE4_PAPLA|nr:hypothetical protein DB88DRAFT_483740 [Papiliotrema laurentii]